MTGKPLNFVQITDMHLSHPDLDDPDKRSDTVANLQLAIARITELSPRPEFVIASGDLVNLGDVASYQLVKEMLEKLNLPILYALGNHDKRAEFRQVFLKEPNNDAPYFHRVAYGNLQIVTLDTSQPTRVSGGLCNAQFECLEQALRENPKQPTLLVFHHPPLIEEDTFAWESLNQKDSDRLAATLQGHSLVGMICGHIHRDRICNWHGIPILFSCGLYASFDVLRGPDMLVDEGIGITFCTYRNSGLSATFIPLLPKRKSLGEITQERLKSFD